MLCTFGFAIKQGKFAKQFKYIYAMLIIRTLVLKENTSSQTGTTLDEPDFFIFYHIILPTAQQDINVNIPILQARKLRFKAIN